MTQRAAQPIHTAPRDGTEVLAWSKEGKNWHQVYWKDWKNWQWMRKFPSRWAMRWNEDYSQHDGDFSHGTPLPEPPTA